jgi:hypothetical protein
LAISEFTLMTLFARGPWLEEKMLDIAAERERVLEGQRFASELLPAREAFGTARTSASTLTPFW